MEQLRSNGLWDSHLIHQPAPEMENNNNSK